VENQLKKAMAQNSNLHVAHRIRCAAKYLAIALASFAVFCGSSQSETLFPSRVIRLIVPVAPGGGADAVARMLSEKMSLSLGVPIIIENKAGRSAIVPRIVIDASGDGDVAARAGAAFTVGEDGATQFASTMLRFGGVDVARFLELPRAGRLERLERAAADGYALPRTSAGLQVHPNDGVVHANVTRIRQPDGSSYDLLDPWALTAAEIEGRRQAYLYEEVLQRYMPGFERARIVDMGAHLGVRETRLVEGDYRLTEADVRGCANPADTIACCAWPMEMHGADRGTVWDWLPEGDWFGIPYRALTVKGFDNLLVAGRNLSATHAAQSSARVAATCMAMGEAAGTAAALALSTDADIRRVGIGPLRNNLSAHGCLLVPGPLRAGT